MKRLKFLTTVAVAALLLAACSAPEQNAAPTNETSSTATPQSTEEKSAQQFPDVLEAKLTRQNGEYMIDVTISSPYDTPERYADGWRVKTKDGEVLAEHELAHDHADEQPFTRQRGPFSIPDGVDEVVVEGHDQTHGYGGETVTITVPR